MYKAEELIDQRNKEFLSKINYNYHLYPEKKINEKLAELHLDENLRIIDFNGCVENFIYITPEDVGRPIFHFATTFRYEALTDDILFCINNHTEHQVLIRSHKNSLNVLKIVPFQQNNDRLVLLSFYAVTSKEMLNTTVASSTNRKHTAIDVETLVTKNEELARINRELLTTAYTLAHDLKQPLNTINKLVELLLRIHKTDLKESSKMYFNYINISLKSMKDLVNGVLEHAKNIHQQKVLMEWINVSDLIQRVKISLLGITTNKDVIIQSENLPTYIFANEVRLYQLFFNLLSNAIKFRKQSDQCRILIKAKEEVSFWNFSVTDNGIGIEKKHFDNIFKLLTKLNDTDEYTGNGIGLAICKRIVEQHKGQISVSSKFGYGSTFTFSIKK